MDMNLTNAVKHLELSIGKTPLVELDRLMPSQTFNIFGKMELLNPGGSMKDRAAISMIKDGILNGNINSQSILVESSSGNMGISLARMARYLSLEFICVVDERTNSRTISIIQAYGAKVIVIKSQTVNSENLLKARLAKVQDIVRKNPRAYWLNQYQNISNSKGYHSLMEELAQQISRIDFIFCATGTCGTIRGISDYIAQRNLKTKLIAVDAKGSTIFGGKQGTRNIPGHGSSITPPLLEKSKILDVIKISDLEAVLGCAKLLSSEGILAGGSTGAIVSALEKYQNQIGDNSNIAFLIADSGERYLDTIYNRSWVKNKFGHIL